MLRPILYTLLSLGALAAFAWFFVSQLESGRTDDGLAAVIQAPPPGYEIVGQGELTRRCGR